MRLGSGDSRFRHLVAAVAFGHSERQPPAWAFKILLRSGGQVPCWPAIAPQHSSPLPCPYMQPTTPAPGRTPLGPVSDGTWRVTQQLNQARAALVGGHHDPQRTTS